VLPYKTTSEKAMHLFETYVRYLISKFNYISNIKKRKNPKEALIACGKSSLGFINGVHQR